MSSNTNTITSFLYPCSPLDCSKVDESYIEEYFASKNKGLSVHILDIDNISHCKIIPAIPDNAKIVYRGWMLNAASYELLEKRFGTQLVISKQDYLNAHHLPNWYEDLKLLTIPSIITNEHEVYDQLHLFEGKAFLKDFVKSLKTGKGSVVDSDEDIMRALSDMRHFKGTIEGGLVLRQVIDLIPHSETRYFVLNHIIYCPIVDRGKYEFVKKVVDKLKHKNLQFYSVDVAVTSAHNLVVVEIGDGQVSDYVGWDVENFVLVLAHFNYRNESVSTQQIKTKKVIASIIRKDNKFLIAQRAKHDDLYGKWEFPGGKMEEGETEHECLQRELFEEFNIKAEIGEYLCSSYFEHKGNPMEMRAYFVTSFSGEFVLNDHQQIKWVEKGELLNYEMPNPDKPIVDKLLEQ